MKVRGVMVKEVKFCSAGTNLAAATEILWKEGVGSLPVVEDGRVLGTITDRDIAIALGDIRHAGCHRRVARFCAPL